MSEIEALLESLGWQRHIVFGDLWYMSPSEDRAMDLSDGWRLCALDDDWPGRWMGIDDGETIGELKEALGIPAEALLAAGGSVGKEEITGGQTRLAASSRPCTGGGGSQSPSAEQYSSTFRQIQQEIQRNCDLIGSLALVLSTARALDEQVRP